MNQDQIFNAIQQVLPVFHQYHANGTATISPDQQAILQQVYKTIVPGSNMKMTCRSCVIHALNTCASYYEREYPKYLQATMNHEAQVSEATTPAKSKAGGCKKCKQKN
jgi:hypothetical protein